MSTNQMKVMRGKDAQYMRSWLSQLAPEERFSAREVGNAVAEKHPEVSFRGTLKPRWQQLLAKGMVESEQQPGGRHWDYWLTPEGEEFWRWMMNTDEGRSWGKNGKSSKKATGGVPKASSSEGPLDGAPTYTSPIVLDEIDANEFGLVWALVPADVDIAWIEILGDGKKKAHKIPRKSEQAPVLTREERMAAKLREMGMDPDEV